MRFVNPNKESARSCPKETAAKPIPDRYAAWKKRWAARMGDRYNRLPLRSKIITLLCFVVLTGGYSIFLVASAFKDKPLRGPSIMHISIPRHIRKTVHNLAPDYITRDKEYQRIHRFRMYMDSLYKDPLGRRLYDSIIRRHPGLMDSVYRIDNNF